MVSYSAINFWATFVKRFTLCYRTVVLSVCSVCNVGVLWPNGCMDKDETWHIVLDGDQAPQKRAQPSAQFSAHVCCDQTDG